VFYAEPRLVQHLEDAGIAALTAHYKELLPATAAVHLDLCSSWVSNFPAGYAPQKVIGVGLQAEELSHNPILTERHALDLNQDPQALDRVLVANSLDAATLALSIQYLTSPVEVISSVYKALRSGGVLTITFGKHLFECKTVNAWFGASPLQRVALCTAYMKYAGEWSDVRVLYDDESEVWTVAAWR
jgi:SAM-dependent methyltransferase